MRRRANRARHRRARDPRGHWLLLLLILPVMFGALLFEGWTTHEVDAAKTRKDCTSPVPRSVDKGGPVLRFHDGKAVSSAVPARTVALTYDGGPDPVWTPRLLDLLRKYHAHATFFLRGAQAAQYPDLVRRIRAEGHEIGSNTYTGAAMGASSPLRASLEQSLTQKVLAGSAGLHTKLLRLPQTTAVDTMCGAEWKAARKAGAEGYTLVAADRWFRNPSQGVIRQFGQNDLAYLGTKELLDNPKADRFTTVTAGVGQPPPEVPASGVERWSGTALIWAKALGHAFIGAMAWVLAIAGGLGLLRLAMLVFFARTHVRRLTRIRPGSTVLREVTDPVTVLVPAYNEAAGIESTVRSLLASTHRQLQIIVIDDGSSDGTADIAARIGDPRVRVIRQANAGKAAALNTGLAHARYEIVVMADADTVFERDAIHHLIQPLAHPAVGAVSGNTKVGNRRRLLGRWQHLEYVFGFNLDRRMFEVLECMPTVPGAIGAFRRDALMGVGGISGDTLAEDTDLTMALWQAGWRVLYEESAIAWTEVPTSLRQLWRQRYRWCYGTIQAMWKHRGVVVQTGPAGRSGRRGLSYLVLFQVALPLFAPVVDIFALYGLLFLGPWQSAGVWCGFLLVQLLCAGYALRLDGEKMRSLWAMPFQLLVYRQLMYLVVLQSVVAFLLGTRLKWHRMHRSGTAAQQIGQPVTYRRSTSR
ncbi:glycosyltransferase [Streptomyces sp. DSM 41527]|uniref:Glycosyltransferase n=1 Tax=Streptomyces mooreae TaxID=3075523 RepID=A0ABU2TCH7_9ACTN|nr:glycosyltransferase [Streptomyces sp. DSM 41527]MDT0458643.1 glycosyltransferase [Streptomyces sp. DSM 41527]